MVQVPGLLRRRGDHVAPVDHQQMLLALQPTVEMGVARGQRDTGIAHLNNQIYLVEMALELLLRLGDVAGIPLDRWGAHERKRTEQTASRNEFTLNALAPTSFTRVNPVSYTHLRAHET